MCDICNFILMSALTDNKLQITILTGLTCPNLPKIGQTCPVYQNILAMTWPTSIEFEPIQF